MSQHYCKRGCWQGTGPAAPCNATQSLHNWLAMVRPACKPFKSPIASSELRCAIANLVLSYALRVWHNRFCLAWSLPSLVLLNFTSTDRLGASALSVFINTITTFLKFDPVYFHDLATLGRTKGLTDCGCCAFRLPEGFTAAPLFALGWGKAFPVESKGCLQAVHRNRRQQCVLHNRNMKICNHLPAHASYLGVRQT